MLFPDLPLKSGFYRVLDVDLGPARIVVSAFVALAPDSWSRTPIDIAARHRKGELDTLDLVRQYGVMLDWGHRADLVQDHGAIP